MSKFDELVEKAGPLETGGLIGPRRDRPLLFLDIDGVLNCSSWLRRHWPQYPAPPLELAAAMLKPSLVKRLDDFVTEIDAEFDPLNEPVNQKITDITNTIKADVIIHGATVKSTYRQAVFMAGRVSWDTKALDGYAAAHPEIAPFRKVGEPSVSIRTVK